MPAASAATAKSSRPASTGPGAEFPRLRERTNTALTRLLPEALASVVYAVLDLATGELS